MLQPLLAALAASPLAAPSIARAAAPRGARHRTQRVRSDVAGCGAGGSAAPRSPRRGGANCMDPAAEAGCSAGRSGDAPLAAFAQRGACSATHAAWAQLGAPLAHIGPLGQHHGPCGWRLAPGTMWQPPPPPRPPPGGPPPAQRPPRQDRPAAHVAGPGTGRAEAGAGPVSAGSLGGGPPAGGNRAAAQLLRARLRADAGCTGGDRLPDHDPGSSPAPAAAAAALRGCKRALGSDAGGGSAKRARPGQQDPVGNWPGATACSGPRAGTCGGCSAMEGGEAGEPEADAAEASENVPACLQARTRSLKLCVAVPEQSGAVRGTCALALLRCPANA